MGCWKSVGLTLIRGTQLRHKYVSIYTGVEMTCKICCFPVYSVTLKATAQGLILVSVYNCLSELRRHWAHFPTSSLYEHIVNSTTPLTLPSHQQPYSDNITQKLIAGYCRDTIYAYSYKL
jgi:hypothetical protein